MALAEEFNASTVGEMMSVESFSLVSMVLMKSRDISLGESVMNRGVTFAFANRNTGI